MGALVTPDSGDSGVASGRSRLNNMMRTPTDRPSSRYLTIATRRPEGSR